MKTRLVSIAAAAVALFAADAQAAPPTRSEKEIGYGSNGKDVETIQRVLIDLDFLKLTNNQPRGYYRRQTERGVRALQEAAGLKPTGVWTASTAKAARKLLVSRAEARRQHVAVSQQARKPESDEEFQKKCWILRAKCLDWLRSESAKKETVKEQARPKTVKVEVQARLPRGAKPTLASVFGYKGDEDDNGWGSPFLSPNIKQGIRTRYVIGVALPTDVICDVFDVSPPPPKPQRKHYKSKRAWVHAKQLWYEKVKMIHAEWAKVRNAPGVDLFCPATGKRLTQRPVPIVDLGPGKGPQMRGIGIDLTGPLNKRIGGDGMTRVAYTINAGTHSKSKMF